MKSTIKKIPKSQIEIEIEISPEEFDNYIEKATLDLGKNLEVKGFRKGNLPKEIIEEKLGKENILIEAADLAVKENYRKVVLENKIEAISEPQIDILKLALNNPFIFRAKISILPEVKLPDYKKIAFQVEKNKIFVEEKEVEDALGWLKKYKAKFTLKNGPAAIGDFVEIEYWSSQIAELNQGGAAGLKDAFVLGEGHFISGFEDALVGMRAGEEKKEVLLTLPENYHFKNLAGKKIGFRIKMISVQKMEFPEVNDQFAKSLGKFEDLDALKKNIKEGLSFEKEKAESQRVRNAILEKISRQVQLELPEILVAQELKRILEEFRHNVSESLKISFKDYLDQIKKTEKEITDSFLPEAQKRVKNFLILKEIGGREKINVSEEEVIDEINKILKTHPTVGNGDKELDLEKLKLYTEGAIRNEKIFGLLESFVKI